MCSSCSASTRFPGQRRSTLLMSQVAGWRSGSSGSGRSATPLERSSAVARCGSIQPGIRSGSGTLVSIRYSSASYAYIQFTIVLIGIPYNSAFLRLWSSFVGSFRYLSVYWANVMKYETLRSRFINITLINIHNQNNVLLTLCIATRAINEMITYCWLWCNECVIIPICSFASLSAEFTHPVIIGYVI